MKKNFLLIVFLLFLLSCGGVEETDSDSDETEDIETSDSDTFDGSEVIKFKDVNLEKCVRTKIQKPEGEITVEDVKNVESLDCLRMNIKVLDGIEKLPSLSNISFYENDIKDFSSLKGINTLKKLNIFRNENVDINTLSELNSLEELDVSSCGLTTLEPLKNLEFLKVLSANTNNLTSIEEVKNLTGLESLILNKNYLQNDDLPVLLNLVNLEHLNIRENCITDFTVIDQMKENLPDAEILGGIIEAQDTTRCK